MINIQSASENRFLSEFLINNKLKFAWTGWRKKGGIFKWQDDSQLEYTSWFPLEPNNSGDDEDCIEFHSSPPGRWNDISCCHSLPVFCEKLLIEKKKCTCHYGPGNYCGTRINNKFLQGDCIYNELYYYPGANGLPASSKGICPVFCMENDEGLDSCPLRND